MEHHLADTLILVRTKRWAENPAKPAGILDLQNL